MAQRHVASCAKDAWPVCWNRRRNVVAMNARRIQVDIDFLLMGYRDLHGIDWQSRFGGGLWAQGLRYIPLMPALLK